MEEDLAREPSAGSNPESILLNRIELLEAQKREAEAAAERSQKLAVAAVEELQSFVYAASHDVKEALRAVASYSQLIIRRLPDQPQLAEYGTFVGDGVRAAVEILDRMNTFARIDPSPKVTSVNLAVLVQTLLWTLQPKLQDAGATLTFSDLASLNANEAQIANLLEHLIDNAIKYRSSEALVIHISTVEEDDGIVISVRDNACGIELQYQDQVFKPFKRLHGKHIPGIGLGLAMARKIATAHGGRIWVESDGATGSTFKTFIPF